MRYRTRPVVLLGGGALVLALSLTGCGSGSKSAGGGATPTSSSASTSARSAGGAASGSASGAPSASPAGKTCTAGHTTATINGKSKCLAVGQQCSAKAIDQYPQYGYVCAQSSGKLLLRRK